MGLGAVLQLALGAFSAFSQMSAANKAEDARKEAGEISGANQEIQNRLERRQKAKEERIRRATIAQTSSNTGVAESSGAIGASAALASSFGSSVAGQKSQVLAAKGISKQSIIESNAISRGNAMAGLFSFTSEVVGALDDEGIFG